MVESSFHFHYARLIEIIYALERMETLLNDPAILDRHVRATAGVNALEGVGIAEAPRGTLIHHYKVNEDGAIIWANLIVATGHNNLAISRSVDQVARRYHRRREDAGRHAQPRLGGGARLRSVPELLDPRGRPVSAGHPAGERRWSGGRPAPQLKRRCAPERFLIGRNWPIARVRST